MSNLAKITRNHLDKKAVIYIRQSSVQQVKKNVESQKRQYKLIDRALSFGWTQEKSLVIDDDLGISGSHSENRPGYQKLLSLIVLNEVGIIFGIEVSRLTRNCSDWYQLLDIASTFGVLIGDEDAVYDPTNFNDRLLLGLKGTISEVELQQIKTRMYRGRMNKAKRGDLYNQLPIGYERDPKGNIRISSNEAIRDTISLIFHLFRNLGSIRSVLKELFRRKQECPYFQTGSGSYVLKWRTPRYTQLYSMLKNPLYAGTYVYGRRSVKYNLITKKNVYTIHDPKEWDIVIPNHHEGYIDMEEFEKNRETLKKNSFVDHTQIGASREGRNLLQGIMYCGKCGRKMKSQYSKNKPAYVCNYETEQTVSHRCNYAGAKRVNIRIEELVLSTLNDGTVDLTFGLLKTQKEELLLQKKQWQQKIKRLNYEEGLSRRRYESVDPENRLVASTLEKEWNESLTALNKAQKEFESTFEEPKSPELTVKEVKSLLKDLPQKWVKNELSIQDKKEIIRCVIDKIFVKRNKDSLDIKVHWHGGIVTPLVVNKRLMTNPVVYEEIKELAKTKTDEEIANILNSKGIKTYRGKKWDATRVMGFRIISKIKSCFSKSKTLREKNSPYITSPEFADMIGVSKHSVRLWIQHGMFEVKRGNANKFWIKVNEQLIEDFNGSKIKKDDDMLLNDLLARKQQSISDIVKWAKMKGHRIIRIKENKTFRLYIRRG